MYSVAVSPMTGPMGEFLVPKYLKALEALWSNPQNITLMDFNVIVYVI